MSSESLQQELITLRQRNCQLEHQVETLTSEVEALNQTNVLRQHAEAALKKYVEDLANFYQITPCGYHTLDQNGIFVQINDTELEWLGYAREELVGEKQFADLLTPKSLEIFTANARHFKRQDWVKNLRLEIVCADGKVLPILLSATATSNLNDNSLVSQLIVFEISDRQQFVVNCDQIEEGLQQVKEPLEVLVEKRTAELQETINQLQQKILECEVWLQERHQVEAEQQKAEAQLRDREAFLRSLYDGVGYSIFVHDVVDGNFHQAGWNPVCEQSIQLSASEVVGKTPEEIFGLVEGRQVREKFQRCLDAGTTISYEECITMQGQETWWLTTLNPLKDSQGNIYRLVGTTFDISDRKRAETAFQESQERYRALYVNTPAMMYSVDCQGRIERVSRYWLTHLGYNLGDVLGQQPTDFLTEESRQYVHEIVQPEFRKTGVCWDVSCQFVKKNGDVIDVLLSATSETDDSGQIVRTLVVLVDITKQKQIEEAWRQEQEFAHVVVENVSDGVVACDANGNLKLFNRTARNWHGCDPREVPPEVWGTLYNLYEADGMTPLQTERIPLLRAFQGEVVSEAGMAIVANGQPPRYILASGAPLYDSAGKKIGAVAAMHDITERQHAEAQLRQQAQNLEKALQQLQHAQSQLIQSEKMSSLGQLVAGVAHEINNPVNFIYGNLLHARKYTQDLLHLIQLYQKHYPRPTLELQGEIEAVDLEFLVEDLPKLLFSMKVGADRIQKIVASLRIFSRMDEAEFKAVDIHDGIDSTLMILQNRLKAKSDRPEIQVIKTYGNLPLIECYAGQLNQVFMNILSNAIDALEESWVSHKLSLATQNQPITDRQQQIAAPIIQIRTRITASNQVAICIADNGLGIPETVQQRLFDPFFTTKPVGQGTGMGLSISYQIVTERHKGSLRCFSAPGQGAEFVLEIPVHQ